MYTDMFNGNMKDQHGKTVIPPYRKTASLTSLCTDISPSSSHFFEVLYIGKVRAPSRKIPEKFIDLALTKFRRNELEQCAKRIDNSALYNGIRRPSQDVGIKLTEAESTGEVAGECTSNQLAGHINGLSKSGSEENLVSKVQDVIVNGSKRPRSGSLASSNGFTCVVEHNRTMVFHVGRTDLRLISPDRKQILLHKQLKDLFSAIQGLENPDHFAIICRDSVNNDSFVGYIFKCESESVASEVIVAISQSHLSIEHRKSDNRMVASCDHCPMIWFHKLCAELDGIKDDLAMQVAIYRKLEELPDDEQETIMGKLHASEALSDDEKDQYFHQNKFILMLLKAHCEGKQSRHVHDMENRHEFLNHYLGGSTIFMKAKRSLTNSFDQLLKRKSSKDDIGLLNKELNSLQNVPVVKENTSKKESSKPEDLTLTYKTAETSEKNDEIEDMEYSESGIGTPKSMMNIFLKVGNSPKATNPPEEYNFENAENNRNWRQAIFKNVNTPQKHIPGITPLVEEKEKLDYRDLWMKAINQQILLIRMEKENAKLRAIQEEATVKRIKLEYDDINPLEKESLETWDSILKDRKKYDGHMLLQLIRQGVPRSKRGDIWMFLAEQYIAKILPPVDIAKFPNYKVPYEQLLKQLTSQQHAILIDLGRTFPNHSYFMSPLGPGQLALYNLLKAYSLLDPEVGYCQGLSFIAGVLLLHMSEEHAFLMLRHLMFRRNLRKQYLPDMVAFQIQLYQLTRLLKDLLPDLYHHFDLYEIPATLYAAPWMLTIFASQFPLGFSVRVFDLIFAGDCTVIFKVIVSILKYHKDNLLTCVGFESIMDYLKNAVPIVDKHVLDAVIKYVYTMDISKQLLEYSVEYNVLQEELSCPRSEARHLKQAEETIKLLKEENRGLSEQLKIAVNNSNRLESTRIKYMSQMNKLDAEIKALEVIVATLGNFVNQLSRSRDDVVIPTDILRILSQLNLAEKRRSLSSAEITTLPPAIIQNSDITVNTNITDTESNSNSNNNNNSNKITLGQLRSLRSKYFAKSFDQIANNGKGVSVNSNNNNHHRKLTKSTSFDISTIDDGGQDKMTLTGGGKLSQDDNNQNKNFKFERIIEESDRINSSRSTSTSGNNRSNDDKYCIALSKTTNVDTKLDDNNYLDNFNNNETFINNDDMTTISNNGKNDNSIYPLNCKDIQISYSGATKLRTIMRRTRTKSECDINIPVSLNRRNTLSPQFKSHVMINDYEDNNNNNNLNRVDDNDDDIFIDKSSECSSEILTV